MRLSLVWLLAACASRQNAEPKTGYYSGVAEGYIGSIQVIIKDDTHATFRNLISPHNPPVVDEFPGGYKKTGDKTYCLDTPNHTIEPCFVVVDAETISVTWKQSGNKQLLKRSD